MGDKPRLAEPAPDHAWTKPETYIGAMARKRRFRLARRNPPRRTQPETPRMMLSTVPFVTLIALLAILAVAIMVTAFEGGQPEERMKDAAKERGIAARGWFQEARREFR